MHPEAEKIVNEFMARLQNFRPEDREEFIKRLKQAYCMECGGIRPPGGCVCMKDE